MKLRKIAAIWTSKLIGFVCKIAGKQGVTLAGKAAMRIYPDILKELAGEVREKIFVVCGTNGKTTTNNLLCFTLESQGNKVICNHTGSNMLNGVVSSFVLSAKMNGRIDADYACIEIDEASAVRIFPHFSPDYMILTNLFRDQLDRYGEIDITMGLLKKAMKMVPEMKIIVNGDDSLSAYLVMESKSEYITYGISEQYFEEEKNSHEIREGRFCKRCGEKLHYHFYHYGQLGSYECLDCGFSRPDLDFGAVNIKTGGQLIFDVDNLHINVDYRGFYNIYNIIACYAAAKTAGLQLHNFEQVLRDYNPQNGRMECFVIAGTNVMLNLAKNPTGFNQNIAAVMEDEEDKDLIILINDNAQDGIDISWLWDVEFDRLGDDSIKSITVSGTRCHDMRLRLKYADIPSILELDIEKAIRNCIKNRTGNLYVLVNYTSLYNTHNILKKMEAPYGYFGCQKTR